MLLSTLLALLYVGQRAVPCIEACGVECDSHEGVQASICDGSHTGEEGHSGEASTHHCSHCACICHVPAMSGRGLESVGPVELPAAWSTMALTPPSIPVDSVDHVPLV